MIKCTTLGDEKHLKKKKNSVGNFSQEFMKKGKCDMHEVIDIKCGLKMVVFLG